MGSDREISANVTDINEVVDEIQRLAESGEVASAMTLVDSQLLQHPNYPALAHARAALIANCLPAKVGIPELKM